MTADDILRLFHAAADGDDEAHRLLLDVMPLLEPMDRQWLHDLTHLHADMNGLTIECDGCAS